MFETYDRIEDGQPVKGNGAVTGEMTNDE